MQFLFERLAGIPETSSGQPEAFDLKTAVAAQIQRIVTARPVDPSSNGTGLLAFGMPNVVELAAGNRKELEAYAKRLARFIRHHEPRLLQPNVTLESAPGRLSPYRLVVTGMLEPNGDLQAFRFDLSAH